MRLKDVGIVFEKNLGRCLSNYNLATTNDINTSGEIKVGLCRIHVAENQTASRIVDIYSFRVEAHCIDACCGAFNIERNGMLTLRVGGEARK